jgi:TPR repeat protein
LKSPIYQKNKKIPFSYQFGNGFRQNKSKAKQLFGKACDMRHQDGCKNYKILNEQGY